MSFKAVPNMVSQPEKRTLMPVIKLSEPKTFRPWEKVNCFAVVIKAEHLLSADGKRTNKFFDKIQAAGGIHEYIGYDGIVILSSIMPDKTIFGFSRKAYERMIEVLRPDFYLTPDGETYLGETEISALEINRVVDDTEVLIKSCPYSQPIGLVKGSNASQIGWHTEQLLKLGLSRFVFHAGDYLCRGTSCVTTTAITFAYEVRQRVPWLGIYGIGAMKSLRSFSFADGFITQSHFVNPFYGRFRDPVRVKEDGEKVSRDDIMSELHHIYKDIAAIDLQSTFGNWFSMEVFEQRVDQICLSGTPVNREILREET